jgi:hypothetical protein
MSDRERPRAIIKLVLTVLDDCGPMTANELWEPFASDGLPPISLHSVWAVLRRTEGTEVTRTGEVKRPGPGSRGGRPQVVWRVLSAEEKAGLPGGRAEGGR